jgi:hypothetical protein
MKGVALAGSPPTPGGAVLPAPIVSFDLCEGDRKPSMDGPTVYLAGMGDIDGMIASMREPVGGILQEKQFAGPMSAGRYSSRTRRPTA